MRLITKHLHFFLLFIFCFPCSFLAFGTTADAVVVGGEKIVRANWGGYMGQDPDFGPCIQPDQNQSIEIILSYNLQAGVNIASYPAIYLRYWIIVTNNPGFIIADTSLGVVSFDDMTQSGNNFSEIITVNFSPNSNNFTYKFELLTQDANGNFIPYPIDDYPNLFVEYEEEDVFPLDNKTLLNGVKHLCGRRAFPDFPRDLRNVDLTDLDILPIVPLQSSNTSTIEAHSTKNRLNPTITPTLNLQAYPNPFRDQFTLKGNLTESATLRLLDMQGKLIKTKVLPVDTPKTLDMSSFSSGIYYCQVKTASATQTIKIVKQ